MQTNSSEQQSKTHLYRHFNKDDQLLYVGVSLSSIQRLGQHKDHSHWFQDIARVTIEPFDTRAQALDAERVAIHTEKPLYNLAKRPIELPIQRGEIELTRTVVYRPLYTICEVAESLGLSRIKIRRLIAENVLGCIDIGTPKRPDIRITGWQLIELIESLSKKPILTDLK